MEAHAGRCATSCRVCRGQGEAGANKCALRDVMGHPRDGTGSGHCRVRDVGGVVGWGGEAVLVEWGALLGLIDNFPIV